MQGKRTTKLQGFTLIELLIVVLIIGVLLITVLHLFLEYKTKKKLFGDLVPASSVSLSELHYQELNIGTIGVSIPKNIGVETTSTIYLAVMPNANLKKFTQEKESVLNSVYVENANPQLHTSKLSGRMQCIISSQGLVIKAETPDIQAVRMLGVTRWSWSLRPAEYGEYNVSLALSAMVDIDEKNTAILVKQIRESISVNVSTLEFVTRFIKNHWQWLLTALAAVFVFLIQYNKKENK